MSAKFTIAGLGGAVLPAVPNTVGVAANGPRLAYDARNGNIRVSQGQVRAGLQYTVTAANLPSVDDLKDDHDVFPPSIQQFTRIGPPPPAVRDLIDKAPKTSRWEEFDYLRTYILENVTASGPGAPRSITADRVQDETPPELVPRDDAPSKRAIEGAQRCEVVVHDRANVEDGASDTRARNAVARGLAASGHDRDRARRDRNGPLQAIHVRDRLAAHPGDDVAGVDSRLVRRAPVRHTQDEDALALGHAERIGQIEAEILAAHGERGAAAAGLGRRNLGRAPARRRQGHGCGGSCNRRLGCRGRNGLAGPGSGREPGGAWDRPRLEVEDLDHPSAVAGQDHGHRTAGLQAALYFVEIGGVLQRM